MVTPYYQKGGIAIYNGDCRDIMPSLPVFDIVLTDPPYGILYQSNSRIVKHRKIQNDDALPLAVLDSCIEAARCATYIFCRWDNLSQMAKPKSVLAWVKNNWSMGDLKHEHGRQWEAVAFYPGPDHSFIKRIPDVIYGDRTGNALHPTQKPVAVCRQIIAANVGDMIVDPFMGSGTTLRAAMDLGRKAIGIELDEQYCEIAANRLQQDVFDFEEGGE